MVLFISISRFRKKDIFNPNEEDNIILRVSLLQNLIHELSFSILDC